VIPRNPATETDHCPLITDHCLSAFPVYPLCTIRLPNPRNSSAYASGFERTLAVHAA